MKPFKVELKVIEMNTPDDSVDSRDDPALSLSVRIRLIGIFKKAYGNSEANLRVEKPLKLKEVIKMLTESSPELRRVLVDAELRDPRPNAAILVNGKEISALNGLDTKVNAGDEVVFVPVVHGG